MPKYKYTGRKGGASSQGVIEAADVRSVAQQLRTTGITPVKIEEIKTDTSSIKISFVSKKVSVVDLMLFSQQMGTLQKAGVPLTESLLGLKNSSSNAYWRETLDDLRTCLTNGLDLTTSMRRHPKIFGNFYVSMIRVGEDTGQLQVIFERLFRHLEFEYEMSQRIKSALRYPSFVIMAVIGALFVVNLFVIPAFAKVFKGLHTDLPLMTRILLGSSDFMKSYWWVIAIAMVGSVIGFKSFISGGKGKLWWDKHKMKLPIAGKIISKSTLARFCRSYAVTSQSGVPTLQAMNVIALVVDNEYMKTKIETMRSEIERGESMYAVCTRSGAFDPLVLQMIAIGEEAGALEEMMMQVASMYERDVEHDVKNLSQQIEPILLVFLGAIVLVLALGIFMPMWDMGNAALHQNK